MKVLTLSLKDLVQIAEALESHIRLNAADGPHNLKGPRRLLKRVEAEMHRRSPPVVKAP